MRWAPASSAPITVRYRRGSVTPAASRLIEKSSPAAASTSRSVASSAPFTVSQA
jgi:hypothetical protein